jgi:hypothetical protein
MNGVDRRELNNATIYTYALAVSLFEELDSTARQRVATRALTHMPPKPNPANGAPVDEQMWRDAESWLKKLAGK